MNATPVPQAAAPLERGQAQDQGQRESQQDAFGFSATDDAAFVAHGGQLAVLADGMGGMRNGLWAASHAVQAFIEAYQRKHPDEAIAAALQRALQAANAVVHDEAERLGSVDRMGTTLAAAVVHQLELHWLNVGDSRVYLAEGGHLMRLSTDHSFAEMLRLRVHRGELSAGEALGHPLRHALTSYLGRPEPIAHAASGAAVQLRPGAWVLLCSDGLTQALDDEQISAGLHGSAQQACERLLAAALARQMPDQDNTSVVVLHLPAAEPEAAAAVQPPATAPALRARWREPLWWAGAAAALGALGLLWLARSPPPPPPAAASSRAAPSVDLLAPAASRATP
jgi:protein phosphatase